VIGLDEFGEIAQVEVQPLHLSTEGWGMIPEWSSAKTILDRFMMLSLEIVEAFTVSDFMRIPGKIWSRQLRNLRTAYERGGLSGWRNPFANPDATRQQGSPQGVLSFYATYAFTARHNGRSAYPPAISRNRAYSFRWFYSRHHARRFEWMRDKIAACNFKPVSILELGCHDSRSLGLCP